VEEDSFHRGQRAGRTVFLILLALLLIVRFPFLTIVSMLTPKPPWINSAFVYLTYLLTGITIWWERDNLKRYFFGSETVALFILAPFLEPALAVPLRRMPWRYYKFRWFEMAVAVALLVALLSVRWRFPRPDKRVMTWVAMGAGAGIAFGAINGYLQKVYQPMVIPPGVQLSPASFRALAAAFVTQFTRAATLEEPVLRGFLWGYLRDRKWSDLKITILQVVLFWLGHFYYFPKLPVSFWFTVPAAAALLSLLLWRSRSVTSTMVAHGFVNSMSDLVAHFRWR